ncbi:hypothetical protein SKAU_G00283090 [Synaphobranchus kaupii]|uniref:Uncharacterized protein n=1 Tax=Synaphobranchus kaupii TaxID=118154 RepID=A0A9Q1EXF0_SYNKA|nr:hypothetical protein SKAU_G00283090 [Synaphobranchus kaupii]
MASPAQARAERGSTFLTVGAWGLKQRYAWSPGPLPGTKPGKGPDSLSQLTGDRLGVGGSCAGLRCWESLVIYGLLQAWLPQSSLPSSKESIERNPVWFIPVREKLGSLGQAALRVWDTTVSPGGPFAPRTGRQ